MTPIPIVTVQCLAYNQIQYIKKCLDGFVMQKTSFPFEVIVHDDASTDGTTDVIRHYQKLYPDIIKAVYEVENQYSKHDGSIKKILSDTTSPGSKYIAKCEGDDYWMNPHKLQMQFDFLESHPKHSFVFNAVEYLYPNGKSEEVRRYTHNVDNCPMKDFILGGGGFVKLNAMMYRKSYMDDYPAWAANCPVGDSPLQLVLAHRGNVGYINTVTSCYRVCADGSWTNKMATRSFKQRFVDMVENIRYWNTFDNWSQRKYHCAVLRKNINDIIIFFKSEILHTLCLKS